MSDVITARRLVKRYRRTVAVADVSFSVAEGETVCLLGPNGAGKSTTVRMLATLTRPDGGTALVAGFSVTTQGSAVRARIGYVAQHAGTDPYLTGRENLLIQAAAHRLRGPAAGRRAAELLELVGLARAADRQVGTYSGGMARRLEIAMGIVHDPDVIFLDEPTTGLDPEARASLWDEVSTLARSRRLSLLLTTHYLDEADRLADRLVIINQGRVIIDETPDALRAGLAGDSVIIDLAGLPSGEVIKNVAYGIGARDVVLHDSRLLAKVDHGSRALPALLTGLQQAGVEVAAVAVTRPSLDEVYLHHTGRSLPTAGGDR